MADKEVNLFIVDLGQSMGERHNGRNETDLEYCLPIFWDRIGQIVATGRKTNNVAMMGLGTAGRDNSRNR
jgi:ATP-dependent DNA helicase 2 subunit 2